MKLKHLMCFLLLGICQSNSQVIYQINFGIGGGFSGQTTVFEIKNKTIYKKVGLLKYTIIDSFQVSKKDYKKIIRTASKVFNSQTPFSKPFNMSKFIEITQNGISKKYTWGEPSFEPPNSIIQLNSILNQTIINNQKK
jgi:hypothetical protein